MNETMKMILGRRSVRAYKKEQITDEELNTVLDAAKYAPTGGNAQPWHFSVIQKAEVLQQINEACRAAALKSGNKLFEDRAKAEDFSVYYNAPG